VEFIQGGSYEIVVHDKVTEAPNTMKLSIGEQEWSQFITDSPGTYSFRVAIPHPGKKKIRVDLTRGDDVVGPHQLEVRK